MTEVDKENTGATNMEISSSVEKASGTLGAVSSTKKKGGISYQVPWIEKYRPERLEDMVGNEETLIRLQAIAKDGNLPNLILSGPPGTGKVSSTSNKNGAVA